MTWHEWLRTAKQTRTIYSFPIRHTQEKEEPARPTQTARRQREIPAKKSWRQSLESYYYTTGLDKNTKEQEERQSGHTNEEDSVGE